MEMLGRYEQLTPLSNQNAGSCRWCFAWLNGQEYFIKEYLEPKHPQTDTVSSPEKIARKLRRCQEFENQKVRVIQAINAMSDGNAVRIADFFRVGAKYYSAMPRIRGVAMQEGDVAALVMEDKRRLCAVIAHALACVHAAGYVHSDIKHSNIIFTKTSAHFLTAKLIDYDAGFFEDSPPRNPEQIAGDQVYYAPEVCAAIMGSSMRLTRQADVFSLGILFHQYLTGALPGFDTEQFGCIGEAVMNGAEITVSTDMPEDLHQLICRMLAGGHQDRPTAQEVYDVISKPWRDAAPPVVTPVVSLVPPVPPVPPAPDPDPDRPFRGDAPGRNMWSGLGDL